MIDALVQFLLDEIAFDADNGTSLPALTRFVDYFYSSSASASTSTSQPKPHRQNIDDPFLSFVWDQLVQQDHVRVGVLSPLANHQDGAKKEQDAQEGGEQAAQDGGGAPSPDGQAEGAAEASSGAGKTKPAAPAAIAPGKKRPGAKKAAAAATKPTHEMRILEGEERQEGMLALRDRYGQERLRVLVGEETAWVAITGSYARPTSLTPLIISVLKLVASSREEGVTAVTISKQLGIEPKSVFHCIKIPIGLGLVKKFSDIDQGCRTNRVLHIRYLSRSDKWAIHIASDPSAGANVSANPTQSGDEEDDDDDALGGEGGRGPRGREGELLMTPLSAQYLASNRQLVKSRVLKVLRAKKRRGEGWMLHGDVAPSIGLHHSTSHNLRRLNSIITEMANLDHTVEKILMTKRKEGQKGTTTVQGLRLVVDNKVEGDGEGGNAAPEDEEAEEEEEEEDDPSLYPVFGKTIERQVLDLLMNADSRGMTGAEISRTLGSFAPRFIDTLLSRLLRQPPPTHLSDHTLYSSTETIGRLKQTRWFSLCGYLSFRRERRVPDEKMERVWEGLEEKRVKEAGEKQGWSELKPWEGQVGDAKMRQERLERFQTMQQMGTGIKSKVTKVKAGKKMGGKEGTGGKKTEKEPQSQSQKKKPSKKGKEKAVNQDDPGAGVDAEGEPDEGTAPTPAPAPAPKKVKGPTGRPRKNPLPEGVTESPYMRRKREKIEDEEREKLGLPPIERRKKAGTGAGAKKKKTTTTMQSEGAMGEGGASGQTGGETREEGKKTVKGKGKAKAEEGEEHPSPGPSSSAAAQVGTPSTVAADSPLPPPTKKRARLPKKTVTSTSTASIDGSASMNTPTAAQPDDLAEDAEMSTPAPAPRKRDRPSKKAAAILALANASASPASQAVTAPAAADPVAGPSQPRSIVALSSSIDAASSPVKPFSTLKRRRIEPYVDVVVSTPAAKRRLLISHNVTPGPQPKTPVAGPSKVAATPAVPTPAVPPPVVSSAGSTPAQKAGTPASSARRRGTNRDTRKAASKDNLTNLLRQKEIVDYITFHGGKFAKQYKSNDAIRDWVREARGNVAAPGMDRQVFEAILESAVKAGLLNKTIAADLGGKRREIYYLPHIALDSPEMTAFLTAVPRTGIGGNRFHVYERPADAVIDEDFGDSKDWRGAKTEAHRALVAPEPTEDSDTVKDFFRGEPGVLGRSHGVRNGLTARARQLHKWFASFVFSQNDDSGVVVHQDEHGIIVTQRTMLDAMPLGVFVRIVPLAVESEKLDAFLADEQNLQLSMSNLPVDMDEIIKPRSSKRKAALWKVLDILVSLKLLDRLVPGDGPSSYVAPIRPHEVTHWRFLMTAPVYAVREHNTPLIAVHDLANNDAVAAFWKDLRTASDGSAKGSQYPAPLQHDSLPATFPGSNKFRRELCIASRWRDSYQLSALQRSFLVSLIQYDYELLDRDQDLEVWADCLFAPKDVVEGYLRNYLLRERSRATASQARKRRRMAFKVTRGELEEGEEETTTDEDEPLEPKVALQRKLKGAAVQRERDWTTIVDKFRNDHGQPDLDDGIVDYLHRRFLDPRRQIDALQLDFELRRLLPPSEGQPQGEGTTGAPAPPVPVPQQVQPGQQQLKTVVPIALIRKARLAKDPYSISRQPNIRKRVRAVKTKAVRRPPPAQAPPLHKEDLQPFKMGDQSEFLSVPLPPRPNLEKGQRLARSFYTPEQDDLVLDAIVVLKARAKLLDRRVEYKALEQIFKGHKASAIATHSKRLILKPDDLAYHERMIAAWSRVYKAKKEELEDPNPTSMTQFDLASFIRCLRTNVDKRVIRLTRSGPQVPETVPLPATVDEIEAAYTVRPGEAAVELSAKWEKTWSRQHIASNIREDAACASPYATLHHEGSTKPLLPSKEAERTLAALKLLLTTPDAKYTEEQGAALLEPFKATLDDVVTVLVDKHIMVRAHADEDRRLPGRNFSYDDRFFERFNNRVDMARLASAASFEKDLHNEDSDGVFPLIPAEGDMMAFFDLISEGKLELSVDIDVLSDKALRLDDYRTRQADDNDIECVIEMRPTVPWDESSPPVPDVLLPESLSDDDAALEQARQALAARADDEVAAVARQIESRVVAAGSEGLRISELAPIATAAPAISMLTSPSVGSPLAFIAGTNALVLVSAEHLSAWHFTLTPQPGKDDAKSKRVLPCIWTDLNGEVNLEIWNRAAGWVKGELLGCPGMKTPRLVKKAITRNMLTAVEVQQILLTLFKANKIVRRRAGSDSKHDETESIDWESDGWVLTGAWW